MVGAVKREVAQRGELGLDPVQPRALGWQEHQLNLVVGAPGLDLGVVVRGEVVADHVELLARPASPQRLEQVKELDAVLAGFDVAGTAATR
jgi:hypothetical protein